MLPYLFFLKERIKNFDFVYKIGSAAPLMMIKKILFTSKFLLIKVK